MLERVRAKEAKMKAENVEKEQGPTKVRCEREERIAVVQLKAYWDCFPLPAIRTQPGQTQGRAHRGRRARTLEQLETGIKRRLESRARRR